MQKPPTLPSTTDGRSVQVTDPREIEAVRKGDIKGDFYSDNDVWADIGQLATWRAERASTPMVDEDKRDDNG